jgi:hypothetical protein
MSDPTLATQIITTGTATVSVIGSDGSGKSKILSAAEVRAAAQTLSESEIETLIDESGGGGGGGVTAARVLSYSLLRR